MTKVGQQMRDNARLGLGDRAGESPHQRADTGTYTLDQIFGELFEQVGHLYRPYLNSVYLNTGITNIGETIGNVPIRLMTSNDEWVFNPDDPLNRLLQQPNGFETIDELITALLIHWHIDGIAFLVEPDWRPRMAPAQRAIYVASLNEMRPRFEGSRFVGWYYTRLNTSTELKLTHDHVDVVRFYNPYDRLGGLAPARVARYAIEAHFSANQANAYAMRNGGNLGPIFSTKQLLQKPQADEIAEHIREHYAGPTKSRKPFFAWGDITVDRGTQGMADLDWLAGMLTSAKQIGAVLRTPPIFLGLYEDATFNNTREQKLLWWDMNGLGLIRRLEKVLTRFVLRGERSRYYVKFFLEAVQELMWRQAEFVEKVTGLTSRGFSRNEVNDRFDLGFDDPPYGQVPLIGAGQLPMDVVVEGAAAALGAENQPEGVPHGEEPEGKGQEAGRRQEAIGKRFNRDPSGSASGNGRATGNGRSAFPTPHSAIPNPQSALDSRLDRFSRLLGEIRVSEQGKVRSKASAAIQAAWWKSWFGLRRTTQVGLVKFFDRQHKGLVRRLKTASMPSKAIGKGQEANGEGREGFSDAVRASFDEVIRWILFGVDEETIHLRRVLDPRILDALELAGKQVEKEIGGFSYSLDDPAVRHHLEQQAIRVRDINASTADRLRKALLKGLESNESTIELAQRIDSIMDWSKGPRSYTIAQTEMHEAISAGRDVAMRQAGVDGKKWLSSGGPNVRDSHRYAERVTADKPIPLEGLFELKDDKGTEYARYPSDANLSARNRINCSCVQVSAKLQAKTFGTAWRFYTYEDLLAERQEARGRRREEANGKRQKERRDAEGKRQEARDLAATQGGAR